jgi:hypothetical protein
MKILIEMELDSGFADQLHSTGVTEEGYTLLVQALAPYGDDISIIRDEIEP